MQLSRADLKGDLPTSASMEGTTDQLSATAGKPASARFLIEEICNGLWSIGGTTKTMVAGVRSEE